MGDTHTVSAVNGVPGNVGVGVTGTNGGTFTIASNGSYTFNPGAAFDDLAVGQTRTTSVTYTNLDSNGGSASSTLTITVTGTNDAPVAVADTGTTAENVTLIVNAAGGVLANDTDLDLGDTHTVSAVNGVPGNVGVGVTGTNGGTFTIAANGSYTFNPGAAFDDLAVGQTRTTSVTYTNLDSNGGSASSTLTITVTGTNDAPVAVADTGTTAENVTLTVAAGGVLANDTDLDLGDTHTVSAVNGVPGNVGVGVTGTNGGTFTIAANGSYTFNPGAAFDDLAVGQTRTTSVTYTNLDSNGGSASSTLTITVTGTNDAPVAVNDGPVAVTEDTPATGNVLTNDTDVDTSDTLTVTQFTVAGVPGTFLAGSVANIPGVGTLVINANGTFTFTPAPSYSGPVPTATYTMADGNGGTATADLSFAIVSAVNDAPVANPDTGAVNEDATLVVSAANGVILSGTVPGGVDTDIEGDTLTIIGVTPGTAASVAAVGTANIGSGLVGTYGTLTLNADGSYSYVADQAAADALGAGVTAADTFSYAISDGNGGTAFTTLTITVTGTNDAPVA